MARIEPVTVNVEFTPATEWVVRVEREDGSVKACGPVTSRELADTIAANMTAKPEVSAVLVHERQTPQFRASYAHTIARRIVENENPDVPVAMENAMYRRAFEWLAANGCRVESHADVLSPVVDRWAVLDVDDEVLARGSTPIMAVRKAMGEV